MIKNLLWKQAMKLAKKKFGDLNTNEANKWLVDKYNALLGKENTKNIANKIREDLKRDRPFDNFKPEVVPKQGMFDNIFAKMYREHMGSPKVVKPEVKKFNPFKKEGKKIDFMDYYSKRKRGEFDKGGMILPQAKPYNFEEKLDFLKEIKDGVGPKFYLQMMSDTLSEGVEKGAISKEARDNFLKRFTGTISEDWTSAIDDENLYMYEGDYERYPPKFNEGGLAGMLGETQQVGYAEDRNKIVQELYDKAGGFEGTGKTFSEFMADVLFEGNYLELKKGGSATMTPSEKWMRNYYYDGKGGYDTWMSFQEFQMGPGIDLWYKHIGKKDGGRAGYLKGGLLRTGIMEALDQFTRKGDNAGDWAVNFGEVRDLFKNLDKTFAGKITSKESVDDIITRFRDTRKLDLSKNIKEFLNNKIKQYKSGLENIKKYGQSGSIEEVGDYAEELRYLIKETRKDLDAIDKYGVIQQSKKATKHAEGGIIGLKNGGLLEKYKKVAPKGPWTRGLTDMEITYELYNLLEPYMSLFMKEGGRVGFKEGKGMTRRAFLKLLGGAAALPVVGKYFKLAKPAAKVMDDIKISLRGDGDWDLQDDYWSGGNWVNYSFEALTDKGRKILTKLTKGKDPSLVKEKDGIFYPGKVVKNKSFVDGHYLTDADDYALDAVENIKKAKGRMNLNTRVGNKTKGAKQGEKTYSGKDINKQNILDEVDDMYASDMGGYSRKHFDNEYVEEIIDVISKKAEGGRVGLSKGGGLLKLLETVWNSKFLNKKFFDPKELADKTDDAGRELRKRNLLGQDKWSDIPKTLRNALYVAGGGTGVASLLKYLEKRLGSVDALKEDNVLQDLVDNEGVFEKAEGGRIGLDAGGPPIRIEELKQIKKELSNEELEQMKKEFSGPSITDYLQPRASGSFTTGQPYGPNFKEKTWTDNIGISGMLNLPGGFSLTGDYDKFRTKDRLYTADDEYVDERVRGDHDSWNIGLNWKKNVDLNKLLMKKADGGSVLQRPMFYQGGLTKTVPPKKGPMPQGLQSDVYDGIMRSGVINGRN